MTGARPPSLVLANKLSPSFLGLPAEIRLDIYKHVFQGLPYTLSRYERECFKHPGPTPRLLRVCSQIRAEAQDVYLAHVTCHGSPSAIMDWCRESDDLGSRIYSHRLIQKVVLIDEFFGWQVVPLITLRLPSLRKITSRDYSAAFIVDNDSKNDVKSLVTRPWSDRLTARLSALASGCGRASLVLKLLTQLRSPNNITVSLSWKHVDPRC